jgi:RNA polymerase sigma factor (sigma-70 family)
VKSAGAGEALAAPRAFATTRWSLILSATGSDANKQIAHEALAELCRNYWRPVFLFVVRKGYSVPEAQDLTQDFFVTMLETDWLQQADQHRGRFRSFLLKSVDNFLGHAEERKRAIKRGARFEFVSWDEWVDETPSQFIIPDQAIEPIAPAQFFDLRWAITVVDHALDRLREECESKGRRRLFETLRGYLASERSDVSYTSLAAVLGITEAMVKKQLHNLRERFRWLLRNEVAHTVENPADIDDEIRHLCVVLAAANPAAACC